MMIMTMITVTGEMTMIVVAAGDIVIPIGYGIDGTINGSGSQDAGDREKSCSSVHRSRSDCGWLLWSSLEGRGN